MQRKPVLELDERGAVMIVTAMVIPVVVAFGALAFGVTTLWASRNDVQRATDLAALAAASSTPTASVDLPLAGTENLCPPELDGPDPAVWRERPFYVVTRQLVDGRSAVSTAFGDGAPRVCAQWTYESELLAAVGACVEDVAELAGCRGALEEQLRRSLPVLSDLDASARSAVQALHAGLDPADKLVGDALATRLGDACADEVGTTVLDITAYECAYRLRQLLDAIDHRTGDLLGAVDGRLASLVGPLQRAARQRLLDPVFARGMGFAERAVPRLGFDLAGAAPAVVAPRVKVALDGLDLQPGFSPFSFEMRSTSTARRQIKSVLVLPTMGIPGVEAWASLDPATQARLTDKLGAPASVALEAAFRTGGTIVDPQLYSQAAVVQADRVLDHVDEAETALSNVVADGLCDALPAGVSCPTGDHLVNRRHLLGPFMEDVRDATRPSPAGGPSVQDVLEGYADTDQVVWVVSGLRMVMPQQLFGDDVWETLRNLRGAYTTLTDPPTDVSSLVSPLMFVPAVDVIPATIARDGALFRIDRASAERVAATAGLYKARLVE